MVEFVGGGGAESGVLGGSGAFESFGSVEGDGGADFEVLLQRNFFQHLRRLSRLSLSRRFGDCWTQVREGRWGTQDRGRVRMSTCDSLHGEVSCARLPRTYLKINW